LNELGSVRFAKETEQALQYFNSIDKLKTSHEEKKLPRNISKKLVDPLRKSDLLHPNDQFYIWNMAPSDTSNHPGVLPICLGMPIMIKKNKATECSVTNGAEGIVVGWKSKPLNKDHNMLQVLFVKLTSNPISVTIPEVRRRIVPVRASAYCSCEILWYCPPRMFRVLMQLLCDVTLSHISVTSYHM
jgi:hypothetical protein